MTTAGWMAYTLLVGTLLASAALGLERACRLARVPVRFVWAAALGATVALALTAPYRRPADDSPYVLRMNSVVMDRAAAANATTPLGAVRAAVARFARSGIDTGRRIVAAVERRARPSVDRWLLRAWVALAGALLLLLGGVHLRFARSRRRWPRAELHGASVRVAPQTGPAVVGLARAEIVVPRWLLLRAPEEQRLVIEHEREHLRARDPLLLAGAWAATALLAWHPAAWWMLSRLRLAVELDCDGRVLRGAGVAPRAYGTLLIDLAGRRPGLGAAAAALADQPSHLERRLLAMRHDRTRFARTRSAVLATLSAAALLAACEAKLPTSAEVANMDVASAERVSARTHLLSLNDTTLVYTIDGASASAAQARALLSEEIAAIEVERHKVDGTESGGQVHITTVKAAEAAGGAKSLPRKALVPGELAAGGKFGGVVLIDGVRADAAALQRIDPSTIASVEVIKGAAAAKLYDAPESANGVIRITTKSGKR